MGTAQICLKFGTAEQTPLHDCQAMGQNTSSAVLQAVNTMTGGAFPMKDPLDAANSCVFDDKAWQKALFILPDLYGLVVNLTEILQGNITRFNVTTQICPAIKLVTITKREYHK